MNELRKSKLPKLPQTTIVNKVLGLFFSCGLAFGLGLVKGVVPPPPKDLCNASGYELIQEKMTETDVRALLGSGLERKRIGNRKEIVFCSGNVIVILENNRVLGKERPSAK